MRENNHYTPKDSSRALDASSLVCSERQQPRVGVGSCSEHAVTGREAVVSMQSQTGPVWIMSIQLQKLLFSSSEFHSSMWSAEGLIPSSATDGSWFTRRMTDAARKAWHQALLQLSAWCHYMSSNSCTGSSVSRLNIQSGSRIAIYLCPTLIQTWSSQMK